MKRSPFVLTNGSWHGAWCWTAVLQTLAASGYAAAPVELEGFGGLRGASPLSRRARPFDAVAFASERSRVAGTTLDSAARQLISDLRAVGGGQPCTVVAHSLGGTVVTAAAEAAPELFDALVLVSAMVPVAGMRPSAYNATPEMAESLLTAGITADPAVVGAVRCDFDDPAGRDLARRTFYGDLDANVAEAALSMLSSDAPIGVDEVLSATPERFGSIPRTFVLCTRDRALTPALQRRLISEIDARMPGDTVVHELDAGHAPFLSRPGELAHIIATATTRVRASS